MQIRTRMWWEKCHLGGKNGWKNRNDGSASLLEIANDAGEQIVNSDWNEYMEVPIRDKNVVTSEKDEFNQPKLKTVCR